MTADLYDWEQEDKETLRRYTRFGCKECLDIYVRPRTHDVDVMFLSSCAQHEGWEPEPKGARDG